MLVREERSRLDSEKYEYIEQDKKSAIDWRKRTRKRRTRTGKRLQRSSGLRWTLSRRGCEVHLLLLPAQLLQGEGLQVGANAHGHLADLKQWDV